MPLSARLRRTRLATHVGERRVGPRGLQPEEGKAPKRCTATGDTARSRHADSAPLAPATTITRMGWGQPTLHRPPECGAGRAAALQNVAKRKASKPSKRCADSKHSARLRPRHDVVASSLRFGSVRLGFPRYTNLPVNPARLAEPWLHRTRHGSQSSTIKKASKRCADSKHSARLVQLVLHAAPKPYGKRKASKPSKASKVR